MGIISSYIKARTERIKARNADKEAERLKAAARLEAEKAKRDLIHDYGMAYDERGYIIPVGEGALEAHDDGDALDDLGDFAGRHPIATGVAGAAAFYGAWELMKVVGKMVAR